MNEGTGYTRPKQANTPIKQASRHRDGIETHDGMFLTTSRAFSPPFFGGDILFILSFMAEAFIAAAVVFHVVGIKERGSILSHHWEH